MSRHGNVITGTASLFNIDTTGFAVGSNLRIPGLRYQSTDFAPCAMWTERVSWDGQRMVARVHGSGHYVDIKEEHSDGSASGILDADRITDDVGDIFIRVNYTTNLRPV